MSASNEYVVNQGSRPAVSVLVMRTSSALRPSGAVNIAFLIDLHVTDLTRYFVFIESTCPQDRLSVVPGAKSSYLSMSVRLSAGFLTGERAASYGRLFDLSVISQYFGSRCRP